jgi:hypothetical protein
MIAFRELKPSELSAVSCSFPGAAAFGFQDAKHRFPTTVKADSRQLILTTDY